MADLPAWIFASSCLIGFLLFAGYNGFIAWSNFVLSASTPSYAPVIGGCLGVGAVLALPLGAWTDRVPYVAIPLMLDFGTLPYLALLAREWCRNSGLEKEMTLGEYKERRESQEAGESPSDD